VSKRSNESRPRAHYQTTLREAFAFEGVGLHSGTAARVEVRPAAPGTGIRFLAGGVTIPALAENVVETARATVVGYAGVTISTVEHLLAAIFASGISNADIAVDGPEIPVQDGSAKSFAEAVGRAGIVAQGEIRPQYVPVSASFVRDGDRTIAILPASRFRVKFVADFAPPIGTQYFDSEITPEIFAREIAPARTFGYLHEVEALRERGLARGGTLENALVFAPEGPLRPMRWENEPVRHKVLDLLGDFALLGAWPQCEVIAVKSGHKLHCIATRQLRRDMADAFSGTKARVR
jgi:UDP-3-O-[3-hydroxymyristoyl] N-acetylglucosamine deacetylase